MKKQKLGPGRTALKVLFKEVLQGIPEEAAELLRSGYVNGQNIVLILGQSARGEEYGTAFGWQLTDDNTWRGLPDAVEGIH